MKKYLNQAAHNKEFHNCICDKFVDSFYDWKITILFYVGIHYLKALAAKRGINIGETHSEIDANINPLRDNVNMRINKNAYHEYKNLFRYSITARYSGFTDLDTFQKIQKLNHNNCLIHLEQFKKYIKGQGVIIEA